MARIFISHASVDGETAQRMKTWLDGIGFDKSFLDFDDQAGIAPGDDGSGGDSELERSQAVILILTKHWFGSSGASPNRPGAPLARRFAIIEARLGQFVSTTSST